MQYISVQHDVTSIDKCILRTCKHLKMLMTNGKVKDRRTVEERIKYPVSRGDCKPFKGLRRYVTLLV